MDSKEHLTSNCKTMSTSAPEAHISTQTFKIEIKEEIPEECRDEKESPCSDYMYPPDPLESPEYVNYYDSKMCVLKKLKKEFPEDECPQSDCSIYSTVVSENTELIPLIDKQNVIIENTEDKFLLNLNNADGNSNNHITIKTERLEDKDIRDNSEATSIIYYDVPVTSHEFECKFCGKIFENNYKLLKHCDDHIKNEINTSVDKEIKELHQCQYCDNCYDNYNILLRHVTDVHSENKHKCEICGDRFNSVSNLERHIGLLHKHKNLPNLVSPNDMKCIYCNVDFKHKYRLTNHMKLCCTGRQDEEIKYICDVCERVYKTKRSLVTHIKKTHYEYGRTFECACGKQFPSPIHLTIHKSLRCCTNRKNELYECKRCETVYNLKNSLTRHMKRAHYDYGRTFDCWCGKQFRTPQYLREHMKRHEDKMNDRNNDNVQCDYCQKQFKTKHYLIDHIKIVHYDYGKVFECWCGKQFRTPIHLRQHKKRHSDGKFNDTNSDKLHTLNNHVMLCRTGKDDEKMKNKCDSCERVYKSKQALAAHIKKNHFDYGKMFECWCGKQFPSPIHLTEHKHRHRHSTNGKNELYKCHHCETVYNTKQYITKHIKRLHYDYGKTFDCWCGKQFRTPQYLREHMRRHDDKVENKNNDKVQ